MSTTTPNWTDNIDAIAPTSLVMGNASTGVVVGTIDLSAKHGAWLHLNLGRKGATAPSVAIALRVRRMTNAGGGANTRSSKNLHWANASGVTAGNATTIGADSAVGSRTLNVAANTGIAVGDTLCIYDTSFTRLEFVVVSKIASLVNTVDSPLLFDHTLANGDNVTRQADVFSGIFLPGGAKYEVIADYAAAATGSDYVVWATLERYDTDTTV